MEVAYSASLRRDDLESPWEDKLSFRGRRIVDYTATKCFLRQ